MGARARQSALQRSRSTRAAGLLLLLAAAAAVFVVRGPVRMLVREDPADFGGPYLGAKAWVHGLNPYSPDAYWTMAEDAGWDVGDRIDGFPSRTPYPPPTFAVLAPLAALSWERALVAATVAATVLVLLSVRAAWRASGLGGAGAPGRTLLALSLLLTPLHTAIGTGNPAAAAVALTVIGCYAGLVRRDVFAGAMLALALCLKPLIPLFALGYYGLRGRWRLAAAAAATAGVVTAVAVGRLSLAGVEWLPDYLLNNSFFFANHGGDVIEGSTAQLQFVNLQFLGIPLFGDTRAANVMAMAVTITLALVWLWLHVTRRGDRSALLDLSVLAVVSLLPVYHRIYDAGVLLLPLCWAMSERRAGAARFQWLVLLLMVPFLVPGATFLELQAAAGRIPDRLLDSWWWDVVVVPHQVWALVLMAVVLLAAAARGSARPPAPAPTS